MSVVDDVYARCLSGPHRGELNAQNVSLFFSSPYTIYCDKFVSDKEKDPPSPYRELLRERGLAHEKRAIEGRCPGIVPIRYETVQEGFK